MSIQTASFTVPQGHIGVLRGFRYQLIPQAESPSTAAVVTSTLFINSIAVPDYQNMRLGQSMPNMFPCHILAAAGHIYKLTITVPDALITAATEDMTGQVFFYGNILLAKQVPLPMEVGEELPVHALPLDQDAPTIAPPRGRSTLRLNKKSRRTFGRTMKVR